MPYRVEELEALVPDASGKAVSPKDFQVALNAMESEGYTLVHIVEQHRQWPEAETDEMLANMGGLYGPWFVFHQD